MRRLIILLMILFSSIALASPPATVVTIATSSSIRGGAFCAIPRYHIFMNPNNTDILTVVFGVDSTTVNKVYRSTDAGATWGGLGTWGATRMDYHGCIDGDTSGNIFLGYRVDYDSDSKARYRRYNGTAWETVIDSDDNSGVYHVLKGIDNDVWLFERKLTSSPATLRYRRSTDNGATFGAAADFYTASNSVWKRIGGLIVNSSGVNQPAALVWEWDTTHSHFKIFRWDGVDSFDGIPNNELATTGSAYGSRLFSMTQTPDGTIHCVFQDYISSVYYLKHAYRSYTGTWSAPATIETLTGDYGEMSLTHLDNIVFMFYMNKPAGATYRNIYYRTYNTESPGWSAAVRLSDDTSDVGNCSTAKSIPHGCSYVPVAFDQNDNSARFITILQSGKVIDRGVFVGSGVKVQ